jgi:hypothetical protein
LRSARVSRAGFGILPNAIVVGQALRLPRPAMATGAVALQFCRTFARSFGIIRHGGQHFFYRGFQADPHRPRYDCMTDVEFG